MSDINKLVLTYRRTKRAQIIQEKHQCASCKCTNIQFYEYRELNIIYKCIDCGLLFAEKDGEIFSTMGVRE